MEKIPENNVEDFDWALGLNRVSLRAMGVWPDSKSKEKFFKNELRIPFMVFSMFSFIFLPQMYAMILVCHDLRYVLDNLMTSCPAFTCCLKLIFLWLNKEVLRPVVDSMTSDWLRSKSPREHEIMKNTAALGKFFTLGGYIFIGGSYVCFVVVPLFGLNIRLVSNITDYGKHHLLVQSYYPYDYSKSPNYELTHLSQFFAGLFIAMSLAIPDNYFGALIFHLSAQFEILGMNIENSALEGGIKKLRNESFDKIFGAYIDRHVHLMKMVSAVEQSFTLVILAQLFCMCVMACCLGFRLVHTFRYTDENASIIQIMNLAATLLALMLFTFGDCSASENLILHSTNLFRCVYRSLWYAMPHQDSRNFILMMIASKNPRPLTAGKIWILSMASYASILKSIAGYLSVLIAVNTQ